MTSLSAFRKCWRPLRPQSTLRMTLQTVGLSNAAGAASPGKCHCHPMCLVSLISRSGYGLRSAIRNWPAIGFGSGAVQRHGDTQVGHGTGRYRRNACYAQGVAICSSVKRLLLIVDLLAIDSTIRWREFRGADHLRSSLGLRSTDSVPLLRFLIVGRFSRQILDKRRGSRGQERHNPF